MPRIPIEFQRVFDALKKLGALVDRAEDLVDLLNNITLHVPTIQTPTRTLNTNFQVNTTRPALCFYTVQLAATSTLIGGQNQTIRILSNPANPPTVERCRGFLLLTQALGVNAQLQSAQAVSLSYLVPAGHWVRIDSTGTGTGTLITSVELIF